MMVDMKVNAELSITNVNGDTFNSETKFTKLVVDIVQGANRMSYDSSKSDDELDQMGLMLKSQMSPMLNAVISSKGNNLGEVIESTSSAPFPGSENIGQSNVIFPKGVVRVGDTFKMDRTVGGIIVNSVFTVKSISNTEVLLDLIGTGDANVKGTMTIGKSSGVILKSEIVTKEEAQGVTTTLKFVATKK